jgi:hypothetical protein
MGKNGPPPPQAAKRPALAAAGKNQNLYMYIYCYTQFGVLILAEKTNLTAESNSTA